jgi:hypothetical protein
LSFHSEKIRHRLLSIKLINYAGPESTPPL